MPLLAKLVNCIQLMLCLLQDATPAEAKACHGKPTSALVGAKSSERHQLVE